MWRWCNALYESQIGVLTAADSNQDDELAVSLEAFHDFRKDWQDRDWSVVTWFYWMTYLWNRNYLRDFPLFREDLFLYRGVDDMAKLTCNFIHIEF